MTVKKAIIPVGGLGTRFLPLSKVVPKELWPLVDEPVIQQIIADAKDSVQRKFRTEGVLFCLNLKSRND